MKSKINIKVLKGSMDGVGKPDGTAGRPPQQANPIPPSSSNQQSVQSTRVTNPSVVGSDMPQQLQTQMSAAAISGDFSHLKSPTYT